MKEKLKKLAFCKNTLKHLCNWIIVYRLAKVVDKVPSETLFIKST